MPSLCTFSRWDACCTNRLPAGLLRVQCVLAGLIMVMHSKAASAVDMRTKCFSLSVHLSDTVPLRQPMWTHNTPGPCMFALLSCRFVVAAKLRGSGATGTCCCTAAAVDSCAVSSPLLGVRRLASCMEDHSIGDTVRRCGPNKRPSELCSWHLCDLCIVHPACGTLRAGRCPLCQAPRVVSWFALFLPQQVRVAHVQLWSCLAHSMCTWPSMDAWHTGSACWAMPTTQQPQQVAAHCGAQWCSHARPAAHCGAG
jgi:hypothetical protein